MTATNDARPYSDDDLERLRRCKTRSLHHDALPRWLATLDAATTSLASARALLGECRDVLELMPTSYLAANHLSLQDRIDAFLLAHDSRGGGDEKAVFWLVYGGDWSIQYETSEMGAAERWVSSRDPRDAFHPFRVVPLYAHGLAGEAKVCPSCGSEDPKAKRWDDAGNLNTSPDFRPPAVDSCPDPFHAPSPSKPSSVAGFCGRCGYMAIYPICTKCGEPYPAAHLAENQEPSNERSVPKQAIGASSAGDGSVTEPSKPAFKVGDTVRIVKGQHRGTSPVAPVGKVFSFGAKGDYPYGENGIGVHLPHQPECGACLCHREDVEPCDPPVPAPSDATVRGVVGAIKTAIDIGHGDVSRGLKIMRYMTDALQEGREAPLAGVPFTIEDDETKSPALFWTNPHDGKKESLCRFTWPTHPKEWDVDSWWERLVARILDALNAPAPSRAEVEIPGEAIRAVVVEQLQEMCNKYSGWDYIEVDANDLNNFVSSIRTALAAARGG